MPARSGDAKLQTEAGADAACPLPLATNVAFVKRNGWRRRGNGAGRQPVERSKGHAGRGGVGVSYSQGSAVIAVGMPASIVVPRPTSSATSKRGRGS